ncbi:MAG: hypothetical protein Q8K18_15815 [Burkholderiales bacterium]|nr:hypothetical protein [Burkholderiales bacterium]
MRILFATLFLLTASILSLANGPAPLQPASPPAPEKQSQADADRQSAGCITCHTASDRHTMHANPAVVLGCADCHGGNATVEKPAGSEYGGKDNKAYLNAMSKAHVMPGFPMEWNTPASANPERSYTLLNRESPAFVRFINPSDYRVARESCGACHLPVIQAAERSLMATGAMLWNGAAYNNGILPFKRGVLGEAYTSKGEPATLMNPVQPDDWLTHKGVLPQLFPLPAWETVPPADIFRVFERGGRVIGSQFPEVAIPNSTGKLQLLDEPGRPDIKQSNRGPGTGGRIAVPLINITKTRLNDPLMWFLGTNEQPGDYRSSGCAGCHVVYANDRDPLRSGPYAKYGNDGKTVTADPTIPKDKSGHPLKHEFTRSIPSSQCMICHMHQPNIFVNSFYGFTMWDYESDAPSMWPEKQRYPTDAERRRILDRNPEGAAVRGKWSDPEFLKEVSGLNPTLRDTQFADYHGHGWNFRAIFKRDRKGTLLDKDGKAVADDDPQKFKKSVHLTSIHLDVGMHCADCHFSQDSHGNGHIYGEVAAAIEIECADCHGTADRYPTLFTSGPAARPGGTDMNLMRTPDGRRRFEWKGGKLFQRSVMFPDKEWEMSLVRDSVNPKHPHYNAKAARAKLVAQGEYDNFAQRWGPDIPAGKRAHGDDKMTCQTCHTSWTTSCSGCHMPIEANEKTERHHYEGGFTRNYATYNPQVVRDDMFHIGRHGPVKGGKITPIRSSSALVLSSTNANREKIYIQQAPTAASGYSSQAFAPHYPHTERKTETKTCSDCHLSADNDNNAILAQTLLHGTGYIGLIGYNAWVGEEKHIEAVQVTEWEEPQAVIGSYLHRYAYPDWYADHLKRGRQLVEAHDHTTAGRASCLQLRGEYLYVAEGSGGMRVYDVASIANKGVSQRIISAPFSRLGHNTHIPSKNATCVVLPTTQPIAPLKNQGDLMRVVNQEQPMHPIYNYALITDAEEGLILVDVNTLQDGNPRNNFLKSALTWNGDGILKGARHITMGGSYAYIAATAGVVILNLKDPLKPVVAAVVPLKGAHSTALQIRYLAVTDVTGLRMINVTVPERAKLVESAAVPLADANRIHIARTYAYVAAGREGLVIVDIENPEKPRVYMKFTAGGALNDVRDVTVASTNASAFAYVADGRNGLKVIQLTAPDTQPKFYGFSPEPKPQLIASRRTRTPALSLSRALERDRGVDETGGQVAVFGRIGSRPLNLEEQRKMYLKPDGTPWTVRDNPEPSQKKP